MRGRIEKDASRKRNFKDFEEVGLQNEARKVLLVRIPPSVRRVWDSVKEADRVLGKIRIYKTSANSSTSSSSSTTQAQTQTQTQKVTLHLDESLLQQYYQVKKNVPPVKDYKLKFGSKKDLKMRVFSESQRVELEGQVEDICTLQPELNKSYISFASKRSEKLNRKPPSVKAMTFEEERKLHETRNARERRVIRISTEGDSKGPSTVKLDKALQALGIGNLSGNGALTTDQLRDLVFKLFSVSPFWTMRDLKSRTKQTEKLLKEVIREICIYHKSGPNAAQYELKTQYK